MTVVDLHFGGKQQVSKQSLGSANPCLIVFISATLHYVVNALTNCANKFFFFLFNHQKFKENNIVTYDNVVTFKKISTAAQKL